MDSENNKMMIRLSDSLYTPALDALWEVFRGVCREFRLDPDALYYESSDRLFYEVDYARHRISEFASDDEDCHTGIWYNHRERVALDDERAFLCVTGLMTAMKYLREKQK